MDQNPYTCNYIVTKDPNSVHNLRNMRYEHFFHKSNLHPHKLLNFWEMIEDWTFRDHIFQLKIDGDLCTILRTDLNIVALLEELDNENNVANAVNLNHIIFRILPNKLKTEIVCFSAVSANHKLFNYVTPEFVSNRIRMKVVQCEGYVLSHIDRKYWNPKLIKTAVQNDGSVLEILPDEYITEDLCYISLAQDWRNAKFVPSHLMNQNMKDFIYQSSNPSIIGITKTLSIH